MSPGEATRALARFEREYVGAIIAGLNEGLKQAHRLSVTKYMVGGGPPLPGGTVPGKAAPVLGNKLRIRSGDLRRSIAVIPGMRRGAHFIGGLKAGGHGVNYARIHELGGRTAPHWIIAHNAETLAFMGRDGKMVFREAVMHPGSNIPARPYLRPALEDARPVVIRNIETELQATARRVIG